MFMNDDVDKCVDALKRLRGLPPYDGPMNLSYNDNWFSASIRNEFSPETIEKAEARISIIIKELEEHLAKEKQDKIASKVVSEIKSEIKDIDH